MPILSRFIEGLYFKNDSRSYWRPEHFGVTAQPFQTSGKSSESISGLLLKAAAGKRLGTVMFFQSLHYNLQFHIPQVAFLCRGGWNVLMFDYAGFGLSGGRPRLDGLIDDAQAAYSWWKSHTEMHDNLFLFSQGFGCGPALQFYQKHEEQVKGIVLESAYASKKGWAKDRWGPVIGDFAASQVTAQSPDPVSILPFVKVPLLMIFPERDNYIHANERKAVMNALPKKAQTWIVPNAKFLSIFVGKNTSWHEGFLNFLKANASEVSSGGKRKRKRS